MRKNNDIKWVYDGIYDGGAFRVDERVFNFSKYVYEHNKAAVESKSDTSDEQEDNKKHCS